MLREISIMNALHHPNIVSISNIELPDREEFNSAYIIMEKTDSDLKKITKS